MTTIDLENLKRIVTHGGVFHSDDAMATALLVVAMLKKSDQKMLQSLMSGNQDPEKLVEEIRAKMNPEIEIIRTRNQKVLTQGEKDQNTIIVDVGNGKYDHHQEGAEIREDGHKYAACGLVYRDIKEDLFSDPALQADFEETVIKEIERQDNGEEMAKEGASFSDYCQCMIPGWESKTPMDEAFDKAVWDAVGLVLEIDRTRDIKQAYQNFGLEEKIKTLKEQNEQSQERGRQLAKEAYEQSEQKEVIKLPHPGIDWRSVLPQTEAKFVIYKTATNQVNLQCVPPNKDSFDQKIPIEGNVFDIIRNSNAYPQGEAQPFIHSAGFLAALPLNARVTEENAVSLLEGIANCLIERSREEPVLANEQTAKEPSICVTFGDCDIFVELYDYNEDEVVYNSTQFAKGGNLVLTGNVQDIREQIENYIIEHFDCDYETGSIDLDLCDGGYLRWEDTYYDEDETEEKSYTFDFWIKINGLKPSKEELESIFLENKLPDRFYDYTAISLEGTVDKSDRTDDHYVFLRSNEGYWYEGWSNRVREKFKSEIEPQKYTCSIQKGKKDQICSSIMELVEGYYNEVESLTNEDEILICGNQIKWTNDTIHHGNCCDNKPKVGQFQASVIIGGEVMTENQLKEIFPHALVYDQNIKVPEITNPMGETITKVSTIVPAGTLIGYDNLKTDFLVYQTDDNQMALQCVSLRNGYLEAKIPIDLDALDEMKHSKIYPDGTRQPYVHPSGNLAVLPLNEHMSEKEAMDVLCGIAEHLHQENKVLKDFSLFNPYWAGSTHAEAKAFVYEAMERLGLSKDDLICVDKYALRKELISMYEEREKEDAAEDRETPEDIDDREAPEDIDDLDDIEL